MAATALERLRRLLAKMSREQRHEALQMLPSEVQEALKAFMEASKGSERSTAAATELGKARALTMEEPRRGTQSIGRGILRQAGSPPSYTASIFLPCMPPAPWSQRKRCRGSWSRDLAPPWKASEAKSRTALEAI